MPAEPGGHRAGAPLAAGPSAEDAENERLRAENQQLRADAAELQADVASLAAANAALKEKLARLERPISRNSGNSSMAPSSDDQPGRTPPKDKKPHETRNRKPGKHLAWNDDPDDTVPTPRRPPELHPEPVTHSNSRITPAIPQRTGLNVYPQNIHRRYGIPRHTAAPLPEWIC